jgi:hypothetical protein
MTTLKAQITNNLNKFKNVAALCQRSPINFVELVSIAHLMFASFI